MTGWRRRAAEPACGCSASIPARRDRLGRGRASRRPRRARRAAAPSRRAAHDARRAARRAPRGAAPSSARRWRPDVVALEQSLRRAQRAERVPPRRGARRAMLAAAPRGHRRSREYSPATVKLAVAGHGRAEKDAGARGDRARLGVAERARRRRGRRARARRSVTSSRRADALLARGRAPRRRASRARAAQAAMIARLAGRLAREGARAAGRRRRRRRLQRARLAADLHRLPAAGRGGATSASTPRCARTRSSCSASLDAAERALFHLLLTGVGHRAARRAQRPLRHAGRRISSDAHRGRRRRAPVRRSRASARRSPSASSSSCREQRPRCCAAPRRAARPRRARRRRVAEAVSALVNLGYKRPRPSAPCSACRRPARARSRT